MPHAAQRALLFATRAGDIDMTGHEVPARELFTSMKSKGSSRITWLALFGV